MHQKMSIGVKFWMKEVEELYCLFRENKNTDQLRGDREANLRLCSPKCKKKQVFSRSPIIDKLIGEFLVHY